MDKIEIDMINKPMVKNCIIYCDYITSEKLNKLGWNAYTPYQFYVTDDSVSTMSLDMDSCMMTELIAKNKNERLVYRPSVEQAIMFIKTINPNWHMFVDWDDKLKGYYFVVINKEIEYKYKQPTTPEFEYVDALIWGIEHILNRML